MRKEVETADGRKLAARMADVDQRKVEGHYERWQAASWCARLDLAHACSARAYVAEAVLLACEAT